MIKVCVQYRTLALRFRLDLAIYRQTFSLRLATRQFLEDSSQWSEGCRQPGTRERFTYADLQGMRATNNPHLLSQLKSWTHQLQPDQTFFSIIVLACIYSKGYNDSFLQLIYPVFI